MTRNIFWPWRCVSFLETAFSESPHYLAILNDSLLEMSLNNIPHLWHLRFLWNFGLIALNIRTLNLLPVMHSGIASLSCCYDYWIITPISCLGSFRCSDFYISLLLMCKKSKRFLVLWLLLKSWGSLINTGSVSFTEFHNWNIDYSDSSFYW